MFASWDAFQAPFYTGLARGHSLPLDSTVPTDTFLSVLLQFGDFVVNQFCQLRIRVFQFLEPLFRRLEFLEQAFGFALIPE